MSLTSEVFRDLGGLLLLQGVLHYSHKTALCQNTDRLHWPKSRALRAAGRRGRTQPDPRRTVQRYGSSVKLSQQPYPSGCSFRGVPILRFRDCFEAINYCGSVVDRLPVKIDQLLLDPSTYRDQFVFNAFRKLARQDYLACRDGVDFQHFDTVHRRRVSSIQARFFL